MHIRYEIRDEDCLFPVEISADVHFYMEDHEVRIDCLDDLEVVTWVTPDIGVRADLRGDALGAVCRLLRERIESQWVSFVEACQREFDVQTSPW